MAAPTEKLKLLHRASKIGNVEQLKEVLADPDVQECVNRRSGSHKQTALHEACQENQPLVVDTLLKCDSISVDPVDGRNWTPLCYAVDSGNIETVRKLIARGSKVTHVLNNGDTVLHIAAMKVHLNICKLLLTHGADISAANYNNWTVLHIAAGEGEYNLVKLFLQKGAPVNSQTTYGDTASNMAARNDGENILRLLKDNGADFNLANKNGECPVHSAAMGGHALTLKYLIQNGADVMACDNKMLNVFHLAAKNGHTEIFYTMKEHLTSVKFNSLLNATTNHINGLWVSTVGCGIILANVTPIHLAALEGHSSVIKLLIQLGANKDVEDGNGRTPSDLVKQFKAQMQIWDMDNINAVLDILQRYSLASTQAQDESHVPKPGHGIVNPNKSQGYDSDYHSSSADDMESNIGDLEDCIKQLEIGNIDPKSCYKKKRAVKKKVDRSVLDHREKTEILNKLEALEKAMQSIAEKGSKSGTKSRPQTPHTSRATSSKHVDKIAKKFRAHFTTFLRELNANDHIHYLFQQGAVEIEDVEKVESQATEEEKVKTMMYILFRKPCNIWTEALVESLESYEHTSHLAMLLTD